MSSESKLDDELEDKLEDSVYKQLDYVEQRDVDPWQSPRYLRRQQEGSTMDSELAQCDVEEMA